MRFLALSRCAVSVGLSLASSVVAQQLSTAERAGVERAVGQVMTATEVPSASVGVARGGRVVFAEAFGSAVLPSEAKDGAAAVPATTGVPADARMAYPIGSISKQFTAACLLLLQERGKVRLDDPVAKWFPNFTRANDITIRNLLTHTSGYSDYAPQDYTIPAWTKPVDAGTLVTTWATKPLDFEPGTRWQYSNTNFEIAALIVERVSGERFHDFLWENIVTPLKLKGVLDLDTERGQLQVRGYERHALSCMRPAILEAPGWYFGDAQLAMPVATLLQWDESIVHRTLLSAESYRQMETEFRLKNGTGSGYGLGVFVHTAADGKVTLSHSGEVGGFVSNNVVSLADDVSYAALTNQEARVAGMLTRALGPVLLPGKLDEPQRKAPAPAVAARNTSPDAAHAEAEAQTILAALQKGALDRALFTTDALFYFKPETVADYASSLSPLGKLRNVRQTGMQLRGGMTFRQFDLTFAQRRLSLTTYTMADGKLEQFIVGPES